jgi:hypothetical protein
MILRYRIVFGIKIIAFCEVASREPRAILPHAATGPRAVCATSGLRGGVRDRIGANGGVGLGGATASGPAGAGP